MLTAASVYQIAKELSQKELILLKAKIDTHLKSAETLTDVSNKKKPYSKSEIKEAMIYRLSNGLDIKDIMSEYIQL
jgi:hypothetical protein